MERSCDDNKEIMELLLALGRERYGHGVRMGNS